MVERADAQRADANRGQALLEGVAEPQWIVVVTALRGQDPDGRITQSSGGEGEDALGRGIEPLDVVDREQDRRASGERAERGEERTWKGDSIRRPGCCRLQPGCDGERPTLRLGKLVRDLGQETVEQVAESAERERHLRLHASRHEDPPAGLPSQLDPRAPEHGLADSRLAANQRTARATGQLVDEPRQLGELGLPSDELDVGGNRHAPIVVLSRGSFQASAAEVLGFPRRAPTRPAAVSTLTEQASASERER